MSGSDRSYSSPTSCDCTSTTLTSDRTVRTSLPSRIRLKISWALCSGSLLNSAKSSAIGLSSVCSVSTCVRSAWPLGSFSCCRYTHSSPRVSHGEHVGRTASHCMNTEISREGGTSVISLQDTDQSPPLLPLSSHQHFRPTMSITNTPHTTNTARHTFCFFFRHDSHAICTNVRWRLRARNPGCGVFEADGSDRNGLSFVKSAGAECVPRAPGLASSTNLAGAG